MDKRLYQVTLPNGIELSLYIDNRVRIGDVVEHSGKEYIVEGIAYSKGAPSMILNEYRVRGYYEASNIR